MVNKNKTGNKNNKKWPFTYRLEN